jgi:ABC-2 type transport system permease protein
MDVLKSETFVAVAPNVDSLVYWPALAVLGDPAALAGVLAASLVLIAVSIVTFSPRFGDLAVAATSISTTVTRQRRWSKGFRRPTRKRALRQKEWMLLRRDPWLMSQSLMQILYLLPPFFMLWRSFYGDSNGVNLLVPVLIMAAGQLAGGLAWLAVSGEDAPDLIGSAPITPARVWRAKAEAVAGVIGMVFGPAVAGLAIVDPMLGLVAFLGIATAAASATLIQFWFRAQVRRSLFRRRHVSSRIATFAEAFSSITWSGAGALALVNPLLAIVPGGAALVVLAGAWSISPRRG